MDSTWTSQTSEDLTSYVVDISQYDTNGFCAGYTLRRHKYEAEANAGSHEARADWIKYIGPIERFGGCNPINGNFTAVVLPLCLPERIRLIAYIHEYAFLYDNVIEVANSATAGNADDHDGRTRMNPAIGKKQLEAKMVYNLTQIDKECTERVMRVWKEMIATTVRDQDKNFRSLEDYVDFRIIDTGAPFVESLLLFGMGLQLTEEEDEKLAAVVRPCFAALGLANDYFSFDREWEEFTRSGASTLTNSVWLHMQWHNVNVPTAKDMVRQATAHYEKEFLAQCENFRRANAPVSEKLDRYLKALHYEISGNVVWSLNCPRYHPNFEYDPNAGIENDLTIKFNPNLHMQTLEIPARTSTPSSRRSFSQGEEPSRTLDYGDLWERSSSSRSPTTLSERSESSEHSDVATTPSTYSDPSSYSPKRRTSIEIPRNVRLSTEQVKAPFEYIRSLPSKGLRDVFIDALAIWLEVPQQTTSRIKDIVGRLHSASLLLDDFEDGSDLRRGKPAAHIIFGAPQTINSANFAIIEAIKEARQLDHPEAMDIILEDLLDLHIGQSYDLHWTRHTQCPSEDEYLEMVGKKTGGLFRLAARLMLCGRTDAMFKKDVEKLVELIGVHFQIRDDYQNLQSAEYSSQKGFCEDLDEGKYSFPLIHALNNPGPETLQLREIMQRRSDTGFLTEPQKRLVLDFLERSGSMEYTRQTLLRLQGQTEADVGRLESATGRENWVMKLFLLKLKV